MNLLDAVIFGIVEGLTEFLPISSTGHLILTARILGIGQDNFLKSFEIAIQLGAILSVVVLYWRMLTINLQLLKKVIIAFIPTAALGLIFYKIIKRFFLGNIQIVIWSLFLGGIFIIIFELLHKEKSEAPEGFSVSYKHAFIIGIFQSIAMIPGVSRSAATIIGGLILGIKRKTIVDFSFLLAIPTMLAAASLDLLKNAQGFSLGQLGFLLTGFTASFLTAFLAIRFFLYFIKNNNFIIFGIYRILIALLFWFF